MYLGRGLHYLNYRLFACNRKGYGIHSPFVFDLVSKTFRNKTATDVVLMIEEIRRRNLSDKRVIKVTDLGSGSGKMKNNNRKVADITRYSSVSKKYGMLLYNLASRFGGDTIIELGTSLGISAMYLAAGSPRSVVYTIEGCPATASIAEENFSAGGFDNIRLVTGAFDEKLPEILKSAAGAGLVYIDGNHRKNPVIDYYRSISSSATSNTVIVIDDIHLNNEMVLAWNEIRNDPAVTVSIDIFRMGLVFFRKGMTKFDLAVSY